VLSSPPRLDQHCMVAWLRKKAECPNCRASVWPVQANNILFHYLPGPAVAGGRAADARGGGGDGAAGAAQPPQDPSMQNAAAAPSQQPAASSAVPAAPDNAVLSLSPPSGDSPFHAAAASSLCSVPSLDSEAEILHSYTCLHRDAAHDAIAAAAAAVAPLPTPAACDAVSGASSPVACAAAVGAAAGAGAAAADAGEWTPVLRRRRRRAM
jgi:hypothetical protein